jgi:nucleoid-associated protein YgaU
MESVDKEMIALQNLKSVGTVLTMKYGGRFDAKLWRMDELSFRTIQRHSVTNEPIHVEADITLKLASDIKLTVGPVSGGKKTTAKPPSKSKTRYYKVKKGDTLLKLANKLYGSPSRWRYLADKNKIKNPKKTKKLKTGSRIKY